MRNERRENFLRKTIEEGKKNKNYIMSLPYYFDCSLELIEILDKKLKDIK